MKKMIYSFTLLCVLSIAAQPSFSFSISGNSTTHTPDNGSKIKEIKIVSSRASGDMQLRFMAEKSGKVTIKVLNDAGQMVLKQTNNVSASVNSIPLKNALELSEGQYTVYLITGSETNSASFLIWK